MTDFIHYVDTDFTGTSDGSQANPYKSKQAFSTAEATTIADGDRHIVYCIGIADDVATSAFNPSSDGWVTAGTGELIIVGNSDDNPTAWDASKYTWKAFGASRPLLLDDINISYQNVQRLYTGSYVAHAQSVSGPDKFKSIGLLNVVDDWSGATNGTRDHLEILGTGTTADGTFTRENCLILGTLTGDISANYIKGGTYTSSKLTIESVSGTLALADSPSAIDYTDSAAGGAFTASTKQAPTFTNCATEAGIGSNAVTVTDWDLEFTDAANGDFSLLLTSQLLGSGSTGNNIGVDQTTEAANQAPIADNDTFSIFDNAANCSRVGTWK